MKPVQPEIDEKIIRETESRINNISKQIRERWEKGNFEGTKKRLDELKEMMSDASFWNDQEKAKEIIKEEKSLKTTYLPWSKLLRSAKETSEFLSMAREEKDEESLKDAISDAKKLFLEYEKQESIALLDEEDDDKNAYLTIHPGAGGTESQDWAEMLFRMFSRWAEKNKFGTQIIDYTYGEQAGIKSATILIRGENIYGLLKSEIGVHRLVRISPFDSNKRRHTSFASVFVNPEVDESFEIEIDEEDLRIDTYRSSGAGGQHVNTTDSAVRITHLPTGIVTQCQNERSQHKNKASAMKVLMSSLYQFEKQKKEAELREKSPEKKDIAWGSQIRSYVFHPYNMVKDHRTNFETGNVLSVMDGTLLDDFIYAYLKAKSLNQF